MALAHSSSSQTSAPRHFWDTPLMRWFRQSGDCRRRAAEQQAALWRARELLTLGIRKSLEFHDLAGAHTLQSVSASARAGDLAFSRSAFSAASRRLRQAYDRSSPA